MASDILLTCHTCKKQGRWPDKGLGRASAHAWLTNHQGHEITKDWEVKS